MSVYWYSLVSDVVELELCPEGPVIAAEPPEVLVGGTVSSGQELSVGEYVIDVASGLVPRVSCKMVLSWFLQFSAMSFDRDSDSAQSLHEP